MTISFPTALRNSRADAITTYAGSAAFVRFYDGTPPASANAALSGNTLLAECQEAGAFAPSASGGVLSPNNPAADTSANATGTCTFFRVYKSDGTTVVMQGSVGTSGADCIVNTTSFNSGVQVEVTDFDLTEGNA